MQYIKNIIEFFWLNISNKFNKEFYLKKYPDVKEAKIDPIKHYILFGKNENRNYILNKKILFSKHSDWNKIISHSIYNDILEVFNDFDNYINYEEFDYIIPLNTEDAIFLNKNYSHLKNKKFILPSSNIIELCNDKFKFNNFLIAKGYEKYLPKFDNLTFPYILKKAIDSHGNNSIIINNGEDENRYKYLLNSNEYFKQEYIKEDCEYTTHIFFHDKKILFHKTIKYLFNTNLYIKSQNHQPIENYFIEVTPFLNIFEAILESLNYEGICCFNYAISNNELKIFELNPRIGGSLMFNINSLIDIYDKLLKSDLNVK